MSLTDERIRAFLVRQRERESSESQGKLIHLLPIACDENDSAMQLSSKDDTIASLNNCIRIPEVQNESDYSINLDKSKREEPSGLYLNLNDLKVRPEFIKFNTPCTSPPRQNLRQDVSLAGRLDFCLANQRSIQPHEKYTRCGNRTQYTKNVRKERSSTPSKTEKSGQIDRYLARSQLLRARARENSKGSSRGKCENKTAGNFTNREGRECESPISPPRQPRQRSSQDEKRPNSRRSSDKSAKNRIPPLENLHKIEPSSPNGNSARSDASYKGAKQIAELNKLIRKGRYASSSVGLSANKSSGALTNEFHSSKHVNKPDLFDFVSKSDTKRSMHSNSSASKQDETKSDRKPPKSAAMNRINSSQQSKCSGSKELDNSIEESMLKQEVRVLIDTIRNEKDKVFHDMKLMSNKLSKYKSAYKHMKNQLKMVQAKSLNAQEEETLSIQREKDESETKTPMIMSRSGQSRKNPIEDVEPFTIDTLELTPQKNLRASQNSLRDKKLYDCIENLNFDVEKLVMKAPLKQMKGGDKVADAGLKAFEFDKNPVALSVVRELQLDVKVFNREQDKTPRESISSSDLAQVSAAQKEIIKYLYSKLLHEERQRLETEEQAHLMISTMEKSLSQMEGRLKAFEANSKKQDNTGYSSATAEGDGSRLISRE